MPIVSGNPAGMCERSVVHDDKPAVWLLRRTCPHCEFYQVLAVCEACKDYITSRNERARGSWRCLKCGKNRDMPQGMDILGKA